MHEQAPALDNLARHCEVPQGTAAIHFKAGTPHGAPVFFFAPLHPLAHAFRIIKAPNVLYRQNNFPEAKTLHFSAPNYIYYLNVVGG